MEYDTIIIGAGMSGLAAGIRLAHYGRRVLVLERQRAIGGLNSFYRRGNRLIDVGLHVVTNYVPNGMRGPLRRLLRQLRISWDEFSLSPQYGSSVRFPGYTLRFTNDVAILKSEIRTYFPDQIDGFERLASHVADYAHLGTPACRVPARSVVREFITDPQLEEMIFCPLLFYGGPGGRELDFGQFSILFRSIFLEGFGRPREGIRQILRQLFDKFSGLGGELRLKTVVQRLVVRNQRIEAVILNDGTELRAKRILSSAGWPETLKLCEEPPESADGEADTDGNEGGAVETPSVTAGDLAFTESIAVLDRPPAELGITDTVTFFSRTPFFHYEPADSTVDLRSGLICCPDNYHYDKPLDESMIRITALAGYDAWNRLSSAEYRLEKGLCFRQITESVTIGSEWGPGLIPDFRSHIVDTDLFTPRTVRRFTGRIHGAIYGAPEKRYDGTTHLANLYLCGTDQGLVGIIGSLISGIMIANRYCLETP